jgi:nitroimidazol reductase NimA-like FMN-containing flavoprotein (pyridoxamine 5'-phosphate oxidase superfamily)
MSEPVEMTVEECVDLLRAGVVGRVGLSTPMGPRIVPVNYAIVDDAVVFRTTPYSELGTYGWNTDLAFEIDHLDYEKHQGWSVVAIGRAELVDDPEELADIRAHWDPTPWAGGRRHLYVRLRWRDVSGRRIGGDWSRRTMTPVRRAL